MDVNRYYIGSQERVRFTGNELSAPPYPRRNRPFVWRQSRRLNESQAALPQHGRDEDKGGELLLRKEVGI